MTSRTKRLPGILAGTALALLFGGPSVAAPPVPSPTAHRSAGLQAGIVLVQDEGGGEEQPRKRRQRGEQQAEEQPGEAEEQPRERRRRAQQAEERPAEGEEGGQRQRRRQQQAEEQPGEAEQQPRERRRGAQQAEERPAEGEEGNGRRNRRERQQQAEEAAQQEEQQRAEQQQREQRQQEAEQAEQSRREQQAENKRRKQEQAEQERQQAEEQKQAERERRRQQQAEDQQENLDKANEENATRQRQAEERQRQQEQARQERDAQRREQQAEDEQRRQAEQAEQEDRERRRQQAEGAEPGDGGGEETAGERPRRNGQDGGEAEQAEGSNRNEGRRPRGQDNAELPPGEAPAAEAEQRDEGEGGNRRPRRERADNGPPPADDRAAQEDVRPERVESVEAEQGTRRRESRNDDDEPNRRERPRGADVLREIGDRLILRYNDQVLVESSDRPRLRRNARDVYTEDLPNQRTRETVIRDNGVRVVTVRNRYGDVIRRSRITPDGREYVLNYVDEDDTPRVRDWRDPGLDLPPFQPNVPEEEYILDAERAPSSEDYYEFLEKPPVERVERLYSLDEVKRSARVRQKTRRVDLDTITFDFGSASVPEAQITKLEGVATAMERLLKENPAETFLIEGHTDAVGSNEANLALSDRRAESVAEALTNVFAIPPENLATQGYGEQYLKVQTSEPDRENRRVAIRRITPLVAPVSASAQ